MRKLPIILSTMIAVACVADAAPDPNSDDVHVSVEAHRGRLGVGILQISSELRKHFGAPEDRGVLVDTVRPDSAAARAGLRSGDLILEVDGTPARSVADVVGALDHHKKGEIATVSAMRGPMRMTLKPKLETDPMPALPAVPAMREWFGSGGADGMWKWFGNGAPDGDLEKRLDALEKRILKLEHA